MGIALNTLWHLRITSSLSPVIHTFWPLRPAGGQDRTDVTRKKRSSIFEILPKKKKECLANMGLNEWAFMSIELFYCYQKKFFFWNGTVIWSGASYNNTLYSVRPVAVSCSLLAVCFLSLSRCCLLLALSMRFFLLLLLFVYRARQKSLLLFCFRVCCLFGSPLWHGCAVSCLQQTTEAARKKLLQLSLVSPLPDVLERVAGALYRSVWKMS